MTINGPRRGRPSARRAVDDAHQRADRTSDSMGEVTTHQLDNVLDIHDAFVDG
jgi:hypothetical protein